MANSGEHDEYGMQSFFIGKHYSDEEKQALWDERGDKKRFRWQAGDATAGSDLNPTRALCARPAHVT